MNGKRIPEHFFFFVPYLDGVHFGGRSGLFAESVWPFQLSTLAHEPAKYMAIVTYMQTRWWSEKNLSGVWHSAGSGASLCSRNRRNKWTDCARNLFPTCCDDIVAIIPATEALERGDSVQFDLESVCSRPFYVFFNIRRTILHVNVV